MPHQHRTPARWGFGVQTQTPGGVIRRLANMVSEKINAISYYDAAGSFLGNNANINVRQHYTQETIDRAETLAAHGTNCGIEVLTEDGVEVIRDRETGFEL